MKSVRILICLALCLALCAGMAAVASAERAEYGVRGEKMVDFTVPTVDGGEFTLSEALKEKDAVLVNLWATWCPPCRMEFPFMEEAYQRYQDRVEIIALSVEPRDTAEKLVDFAEQMGMSFPVARNGDASVNLAALYNKDGLIPTTLLVDRFGTIVFAEVGAQTGAGVFERLFEAVLGDEYTESRVMDGIPPLKPDVERATEEELSAALNAEGGQLTFSHASDPYIWPMTVTEREDRLAVESTNRLSATASEVRVKVDAGEGDALAFEFMTSTEALGDYLQIEVDGRVVKSFAGEHDWTEWAVPLGAGSHEIAFRYIKDNYAEVGEDLIRLDEVRLLSGEEAAAALAALPAYPTAEERGVSLLNEDAVEILLDDPEGFMTSTFVSQSYWIVPSGEARIQVRLQEEDDPEVAFVYRDVDGVYLTMDQLLTDEGAYEVLSDIDSIDKSGYAYSTVCLYLSAEDAINSRGWGVMLFVDEESVDSLLDDINARYVQQPVSWRYADDGAASGAAEAGAEDGGVAEYTILFVDQDGEPVPGCIVNFCTDSACTPVVADEKGVALFSGEPWPYHLQVIRVPDGYEFDTDQEFAAEEAGGETTFVVTRK